MWVLSPTVMKCLRLTPSHFMTVGETTHTTESDAGHQLAPAAKSPEKTLQHAPAAAHRRRKDERMQKENPTETKQRWHDGLQRGPHTRSKGGTLSIAREGKPYGASIALLPTCTTPPVCHNHSVRHPSIPQRLLDALVAQWTHGTPSGPGAGAAAGRWYDGSPAACRSAPRPHRTHMPAAGGRKQSPRVRPHAVWSVSV